jgi:hypothetical protein
MDGVHPHPDQLNAYDASKVVAQPKGEFFGYFHLFQSIYIIHGLYISSAPAMELCLDPIVTVHALERLEGARSKKGPQSTSHPKSQWPSSKRVLPGMCVCVILVSFIYSKTMLSCVVLYLSCNGRRLPPFWLGSHSAYSDEFVP